VIHQLVNRPHQRRNKYINPPVGMQKSNMALQKYSMALQKYSMARQNFMNFCRIVLDLCTMHNFVYMFIV
jgi:hypothetical protein